MKGDNYATIEPPPNTDDQDDPKERNLCKSLYENVCMGNVFFFLINFNFL